MPSDLKWLYDAAADANLAVGGYNDFLEAMDDDSSRQWLYDALTKEGNSLGDYAEYNAKFPVVNGDYQGTGPPEPVFDSTSAEYDYQTAVVHGLDKDAATGEWPSREPTTGRILKGSDHPTFNETIDAEKALGNIVYTNPDDGLIYSHPKDSVEVSAENVLSSEIQVPDSSKLKIEQAGVGDINTGKKDIHSTDYGIPQINDMVWNDIFKNEYGKDLADSLPEEQIKFAVDRILLNKEGDSPNGIKNWAAYNNSSWVQFKDYTNDRYVAELGADPKHLELIDTLAGPEATTIKAVFAAESKFDSSAVKVNYMPSKEGGINAEGGDVVDETGLYGLKKVDVQGQPQYIFTEAPEKSITDNIIKRVGDMWKYRDLSGPSKDVKGARAVEELIRHQSLKDRAEKIGIYNHPRSPEFEKEVRAQVAWNTMSTPMLFTGPQKTALGEGFRKAAVKGRFGIGGLGKSEYDAKMRRMANPREHYKRKLREIGLDAPDDDFQGLAWSQSLSGIAWQIYTGKDVDLTFYDPGDQAQIAAGVLSMGLDPLAWLGFGAGEVIGQGAVRVAGKYASNKLLKLGVSEAVVNSGIAIGKGNLVKGMVGMGGALGGYEGLGSPLRQLHEKGFVDKGQVAMDILAHTSLGMITGALGQGGLSFGKLVRPVGRGAKLIPEGTKFVGEVLGFGGVSPLLIEGRKPEWPIDFVHAAEFLIGMKLVGGVNGVYGKPAVRYAKEGMARLIHGEYLRNGKDFSKAQVTIGEKAKSAIELALEGNIAWEGNAQPGVSTGGKGVVYGEKPNLSVDSRGIAIIYDQFGNRIPYRPALTQKELVLNGEIVRPLVGEDGKPVVGEDGKPRFQTIQSEYHEGSTESRMQGYNDKGQEVDLIIYADKDGSVTKIEVSGVKYAEGAYEQLDALSKVQFVDRAEVADAKLNINTDTNRIVDMIGGGFKPRYGAEGEGGFVTTAMGRGQAPKKATRETMVQEPPEGSGVAKTLDDTYIAYFDNKNVGEFKTRAEADAKIETLTKQTVVAKPISEAVAEQLDLPPHLRGESLRSSPNKVLDLMLKDKETTPREKQVIRVEQERRRGVEAGEKLKVVDVSDMVAERGGLQAEQNKLFEELGRLKEGSPEYDAKEKQIVEIGDRMQSLDLQIGKRTLELSGIEKRELPKEEPPKEEPPPEAAPEVAPEVPPEPPKAPKKEKPITEKELDAIDEKTQILYNKESELVKEIFGKDSDVDEVVVGKDIGEDIIIGAGEWTPQRFKVDPDIAGELTKSQRKKAQKIVDDLNAIEEEVIRRSGAEVEAPAEPTKALTKKESVIPDKELNEYGERENILFDKETELAKEIFGKDSDVEEIIVAKDITEWSLESKGEEVWIPKRYEVDPDIEMTFVERYRAQKIVDDLNAIEKEVIDRVEAPVEKPMQVGDMRKRKEAEALARAEEPAPAKPAPEEPAKAPEPKKWIDITGSKGNKLGEFDQLEEGGKWADYGIRKDKKGGKFIYKVVERRDDQYGVRYHTKDGVPFDTYEKAFAGLADRIAREGTAELDMSRYTPELQQAILKIEATFDHPALRGEVAQGTTAEQYAKDVSKKDLQVLLDATIHQPGLKGSRYLSIGSLNKPVIAKDLLTWQKRGNAAREKLGEAPVEKAPVEVRENYDIYVSKLRERLNKGEVSENISSDLKDFIKSESDINQLEKDLGIKRTISRASISKKGLEQRTHTFDLPFKRSGEKGINNIVPLHIIEVAGKVVDISTLSARKLKAPAPPVEKAPEAPAPAGRPSSEIIGEKIIKANLDIEQAALKTKYPDEYSLLTTERKSEGVDGLYQELYGNKAKIDAIEKDLKDRKIRTHRRNDSSLDVNLADLSMESGSWKDVSHRSPKQLLISLAKGEQIVGKAPPKEPVPIYGQYPKEPPKRAPGETKPVNPEVADLQKKISKLEAGVEEKGRKQAEKVYGEDVPDAIAEKFISDAKKVSASKAKKVKEKIKMIEDAEKGKVREDAPKSIQELVIDKSKIDAKLKAEYAKGEKADAVKVSELLEQKNQLSEDIGKAKLGKPRTGDQVTLTPTKKGGKKVVKKPVDDPVMRGKIEMGNIFESIKDQVGNRAMVDMGPISFEKAGERDLLKRAGNVLIDWSLVSAPEHSRIVERKNGQFLEIDLPFVEGTYKVQLPARVTMNKDGSMATGVNDNPWFKKFSKNAVAQAFKKPGKPRVTGGGGRRTVENAPEFTAPARKALAQQDQKGLNKALKGYQKRLKQYQGFKQPTKEVQHSMGELKEAIKIAEDLIKVQKEADRLGGTIAGMDFIPGTTAFFNAMRQWKRSKLPLSDRKKLDSLVRRSNKLHNKWVAEGRVDREMEGRLEKLSDEIVALESKVANQIPSETEMVKIDRNIKWPSRTRDLRRTHKKQRDLSKQLKETGVENVDENYRDIKLEVTKNRTDSQKDFTRDEINMYETILDDMASNGGYLDNIPAYLIGKDVPIYKELGPKAGYRTKRWGKHLERWMLMHKSMNTGLKYIFPHDYQISLMGKHGKALHNLNSKFVARMQLIQGDGENTIKEIQKLIKKKNMKNFVAAIDPELGEFMDFRGKGKFLSDPNTKKAARLWREYTDRLHDMRKKYETWVTYDIEGKKVRVPADDVYIDNWVRWQLSKDALKDFAKEGPLFQKEVQRLMDKSKKETRAEKEIEAYQIIGEWYRLSPHVQSPVRYGSMDTPRMANLSRELYEKDFTELAPGIAQRGANFLAAAEVYNQDMGVVKEMVGRIGTDPALGRGAAKSGRRAAEYMDTIVLGHGERNPFMMGITRVLGTGYLSGPRSFTNNIMYSNNVDPAAFTWRAAVRGMTGFFNSPEIALTEARKAGQLGVGVREMEQMTFVKGVQKYVSPWISWSEFFNRAKAVMAAGETADIYSKYLSDSISPEIKSRLPLGWRKRMNAKTARLFFKDFGSFSDAEIDRFIERGKMTEAEKNRVKSFAPSVAQGSTHPYFMPPIMSGDLAWTGGLKKMAYRATVGIYKAAIKPLALHGDPAPMMRWIAGSAISGELAYMINWGGFGWEHPAGGNIDDFIEWIKADGIETNDARKIIDRIGMNMMKASGFGLITDSMQGYGMAPIVYDAYLGIVKELGYLRTGKKEFLQVTDDLLTSHLAIWRDWYQAKMAWFSPRAKEYRYWNNVRQYKYRFNEDLKGEETTGEFPLSKHTASFRHIREAWWNIPYMKDMPEKEKEKIISDWKDILIAAQKTIANDKINMYLSKSARDRGVPYDGKYMIDDGSGKFQDATNVMINDKMKEAENTVYGVIKDFHPLSGLSGKLPVKVDGKVLWLKSTGKGSNVNLFWQGLKPHEKENVLKAVEYYYDNIRELKLGGIVK